MVNDDHPKDGGGRARRRKGSETASFGTTARIGHDSSGYYGSRMYRELAAVAQGPGEEHPLPDALVDRVVLGDARHMKELPDGCVHLMVTSPPYNARKDYDQDLSLEEYLDMLHQVFLETYRVLVWGGRACVNVANLGRKPYIPLSDHVSMIMQDIGFLMRGEIIWNKAAAAGISMAWGSWRSASNPVLRDVHEYILVFSKGTFRRSRGEGQESTIARDDFMAWTKSVWTMTPESARRVGHPAPFPVELPRRLIELYTFTGDVVLDPFMGSGTTAVAARQTGRGFVGYEIDPGYVELATRRVEELGRGG